MIVHGKVLKLVASLADQKSAMPVLSYVRIDHGSGHSTLTATDLYTAASFTVPDPEHDVSALADMTWLAHVSRMVGAKYVRLAATDGERHGKMLRKLTGRAACAVGSELSSWCEIDVCEFPDPPIAPPGAVAFKPVMPADYGKGGAFASAVEVVCSDPFRELINCVHVNGDKIEATDGHKAVSYFAAWHLDAEYLIPRDGLRKLLKIVAATAPTHMTAGTDGTNIWFHGVCTKPVQVEWTVVVKLLKSDKPFPDIGKAERDALATMTASVQVDAADIRALWRPFGKQARIVVFRDGSLLAWNDCDANNGIGTTCFGYREDVVVSMLAATAEPAIDSLPPEGKIALRYDPSDIRNPFMLGGMIIMPCVLMSGAVAEAVPPRIFQELRTALDDGEVEQRRAA